jgi:hypothetical protein
LAELPGTEVFLASEQAGGMTGAIATMAYGAIVDERSKMT